MSIAEAKARLLATDPEAELVTVKVTASHLLAGDVCAGSGFTVTHAAYQSSATFRTNKVVVEGYYPSKYGNDVPRRNLWNRSTSISVVRKVRT